MLILHFEFAFRQFGVFSDVRIALFHQLRVQHDAVKTINMMYRIMKKAAVVSSR